VTGENRASFPPTITDARNRLAGTARQVSANFACPSLSVARETEARLIDHASEQRLKRTPATAELVAR